MRRRGMTLIEVIITMAIMTLLSAATLALMTYSRKLIQRTEIRSERNRMLNRLNLNFSERFFHASSAHLLAINGGKGLVMATARDREGQFRTDAQGYPAWSAWETIAIKDKRLCLWRQPAIPFGSGSAPKTIPTVNATEVLAGNVTGFQSAIDTNKTVTLSLSWEQGDDTVATVWRFQAGQGGRE